MKKKTKIILFSVIGVLVIAAVAVGLVFALNNSDSSITGTVTEGTGKYEWRKTDVNIPFGKSSSEKIYSNCGDDGITFIKFYKKFINGGIGGSSYYVYRIEYRQDFNIADDFLAFFVLTDGTNTYTTVTETTHNPIGPDMIDIPLSDLNENYYIKEVWVMTED